MRGQSIAVREAGFLFSSVVDRYYFASRRAHLPTILWVTPFAIFPPAHGGARRITELAKRLTPYVNLLLLSDESDAYQHCTAENFAPFTSAHLLRARRDLAGQTLQSLQTRMADHAPKGLRYELRRLQKQHKVDLVQIEFMEASRLIEERMDDTPFLASLHDVYLDGSAADQLQHEVLARYDAIITCSEEDAAFLAAFPYHVITNGARDRSASSLASPAGKKILFMGPFRYAPNYDGILQFLQSCWPAILVAHPDSELIILGGVDAARTEFSNTLFQQPGVRLVAEFVDPQAYLAACALTINPQQEIRGSALKVAESLLANRVCVTTRQGARGFADLATDALRIADNWAAMTHEINALLGDIAYRHSLECPSIAVCRKLSWDDRANELLHLYKCLLPAKFTGAE